MSFRRYTFSHSSLLNFRLGSTITRLVLMMADKNTRLAWNTIQAYMEHLGKVETWLITFIEDPNGATKTVENADEIISCAYVVKNLETVVRHGMGLEKQIMIVVGMLNIFIRVLATDTSGIITSQEYFQSMSGRFLEFLLKLEDSILHDDKIEENSTDNFNLSSPKLEKSDQTRFTTTVFDSLLTNFAQNDHMKKCLELYFPNKVTPTTGKYYSCYSV